jgi:hypothetical protein
LSIPTGLFGILPAVFGFPTEGRCDELESVQQQQAGRMPTNPVGDFLGYLRLKATE